MQDDANEMTDPSDLIPTVGSKHLPPDPAVMEVVGYNYALPTAIADLVDNSIDAGARQVLIRLVRREQRVVRIYVVDDGRGIPPSQIDRAMTVAAKRTYAANDLGRYGLGLKGASFSQADSLTVMSRSGSPSPRDVGRRWLMEKARNGFECDVVADSFCSAEFSRTWADLTMTSGTIIRLDRLRQAPLGADASVHRRFVTGAVDGLRRHLGIVFHRFLADGRIALLIDVTDEDAQEDPIPTQITALDPFEYRVSGAQGYPKILEAAIGADRFELECHIWTPRSELINFKMGTQSATSFSGFYFYRADRLLQTGGWNGVTSSDADVQLARIRIELTPAYERHLRVTPQKVGVECDDELIRAIESSAAKDADTDFFGFLELARVVRKDSHRGGAGRRRRIPPGKGLAPWVKKSMAQSFEFLPGEEPISVRWRRFGSDPTLLRLDRATRTVWLNERYRADLNSGRPGSMNDSPLLKAMLYLLTEDLFQGSFLGARDRDQLATLEAVLTAAVQLQIDE